MTVRPFVAAQRGMDALHLRNQRYTISLRVTILDRLSGAWHRGHIKSGRVLRAHDASKVYVPPTGGLTGTERTYGAGGRAILNSFRMFFECSMPRKTYLNVSSTRVHDTYTFVRPDEHFQGGGRTFSGERSDIFTRPGEHFQGVDVHFHLPKNVRDCRC